jgi:hypothetical protein
MLEFVNKLSSVVAGNGSYSRFELSSSTYNPPTIMNSSPTLAQFSDPKGENLEPPIFITPYPY